MADLIAKIDAWINEATVDADNGNYLKHFIVNFAKAVIALLDTLGEWPIDVK